MTLDTGNPVFWLFGLLAATAVFLLLRRHFSAEARERRRRERSHGRVVSRKRGPWVKLAVKTRKPKNDRGG